MKCLESGGIMAFENPLNLSVEDMVGLNTDRIWATGLQVFANPEYTMIVFREQMNIQKEDGSDAQMLVKNVASVVMPTEVARQMKDILNRVLVDQPNAG